MKVTRLKSGYRISLSDSDFGMLQWLIIDGLASMEGLEDYELQSNWTPAEKSALSRRQARSDRYNLLTIDEDRR